MAGYYIRYYNIDYSICYSIDLWIVVHIEVVFLSGGIGIHDPVKGVGHAARLLYRFESYLKIKMVR